MLLPTKGENERHQRCAHIFSYANILFQLQQTDSFHIIHLTCLLEPSARAISFLMYSFTDCIIKKRNREEGIKIRSITDGKE